MKWTLFLEIEAFEGKPDSGCMVLHTWPEETAFSIVKTISDGEEFITWNHRAGCDYGCCPKLGSGRMDMTVHVKVKRADQ